MRKVLISPGYGAGWSTWHYGNREEQEFMLFHPGLIHALEQGEDLGLLPSGLQSDVRKLARPGSPLASFLRDWEERFGDGDFPYLGGARDLTVVQVEGQFQVEEYDGSESLRLRGSDDWF